MCLILQRNPGVKLDDEILSNAVSNNPHGWGIMSLNSAGEVKTSYGWGITALLKGTKALMDEDRGFLIHFRWATHGDKTPVNQHPFEIVPGLWLMHNGIVDAPREEDTKHSDTWRFANLVLRPLFESLPTTEDRIGYLRSESFAFLLDAALGYSNKFAFLDAAGPVLFGNYQEEHGLVLSNLHSISPPWTPANTNATGFKWDRYLQGEMVDNITPAPAVNGAAASGTGSCVLVPPARKIERGYADGYGNDDYMDYGVSNTGRSQQWHPHEVEDAIHLIATNPEYAEELVWSDPDKAAELLRQLA